MSDEHDLTAELLPLLDEVSSAGPGPAAGSAAALTTALAAAAVAKAARSARAEWAGAAATAAQADALVARALPLVDADADVFAEASVALHSADGPPDRYLGAKLERAAEVPMQIAAVAADTASLAAEAAERGDSSHHADAVAACFLAAGAVQAAAGLVRVNLAVGSDPERGRMLDALTAQVDDARRRVAS